MAKEIRLPQLGQTMEEGAIVNWLVNVGDKVNEGDVIFEVETDKATLEVEAAAGGFVKKILVEIGRTVPVNTPIMVLGGRDEKVPESFIDSLKAEVPEGKNDATIGMDKAAEPETHVLAKGEAASRAKEVKRKRGKILASPRAKAAAKELGVELLTIPGTGPGGRITEEDVRKAAQKLPAPPAAESKFSLGQKVPLSRLKKIVAQKMLRSKREIPCFYLNSRADVTELVALRSKLNETGSVKISYSDFIMRATALALKQYPLMTGRLAGDYIQLADSINIGLAIAVADGLVAPIVKDVDKKNLTQIATESTELIAKARGNKLSLAELEGGCITITNLGSLGVESFIPIVVPGQCSILGIGRITAACLADDGNITVGKLMNLTLSVDHRIANGAYAAQFLDYLRSLLEDATRFT